MSQPYTIQVGTAVPRAPDRANDSLSSTVGPLPAEVYRYLDLAPTGTGWRAGHCVKSVPHDRPVVSRAATSSLYGLTLGDVSDEEAGSVVTASVLSGTSTQRA